jgi:acyl carrier protein
MAELDFATILQKTRAIVSEQFCVENPEGLDSNANFMKDLAADSLDVVELVLSLEEEFDIEISSEYITKIETIQDAAKLVSEILNSKK